MKKMLVHIAVVAAALVLIACKDPATEVGQGVVRSTPVQPETPAPGRGKPGLDISLLQPQQLIPEARPASIDLSLRSSLPAGELEVSITLPAALELMAGDLQQRLKLPNGKLPLELTVYANRPGKHYIKLHARHLESGGQRIFNAIVWAGEDLESLKKRAAGAAKGDDSGVRELPAQESVY